MATTTTRARKTRTAERRTAERRTAASAVETQIIAGLKEAVAFERGELTGVKVRNVARTARTATASPAPSITAKQIAKLREQLHLSQPVFARALNVSADTVRAWEQRKRVPDGAAVRLLDIAKRHPNIILEMIRER